MKTKHRRLADRQVLFAGCLGVICALAAGPSLAESLYLVAFGIYQTNLDGSNQRLLYPLYPNSLLLEVAANSQTGSLYFIDACSQCGGTITRRVDPGGAPTFVVGMSGFRSITSLTVDELAKKVYYSVVATGEIRRCDLDGQNQQVVFSGLGTYVNGLDVVALSPVQAKLYWAENTASLEGQISRGDVIHGYGMNRETIVSGLGFPADVSVDAAGGKVYWVDGERATIQRANSDGSSVESLINAGLVSPSSIVVDQSMKQLFWVDSGNDEIQRSGLDGSNRETVFSLNAALRIDIGPDGAVGVKQRSWGQMKQLFRSP